MTDRRTWTAELLSERILSRSVRNLVFQAREPAGFHWLPGQHVELFERAEPSRRFAYSLASAQLEASPGLFELAVGRDGSALAVNALRIGGVIEVAEPRGKFVRAGDDPNPSVFIGVGTGVAPLRSMIASALNRPPPGAPLLLLFGCRSEDELLWGDEFAQWAEQPRFDFWPTLSQSGASWSGRKGYVQSHLASLGDALTEADFYVCGSRSMVDDVAGRLVGLGAQPSRLKLEGY